MENQVENQDTFNYIEIVCNFLNNTQGNITENQAIELIKIIQCCEYGTNEIAPYITDEILQQLNDDICCDDYKNFYNNLCKIANNINLNN